MKKHRKKLAGLLAGLIIIIPMVKVGAISVKSIKLKDIVEEVVKDKGLEDKEIDKDEDKDKELSYKLDKEYLDAALKSIEWYRFILDSDKDKNVVTNLKTKLIENGFPKVDVRLVKAETTIGDIDYINKDGDITYHYEDPETSANLNKMIQVKVEFELLKANEKRDYSKNINIGWDKPRVRKMLEEKIFTMINEDLLRGENKDLANIEKDLLLPSKLTKYASIEWESSNRLALDIKDQGYGRVDGKFVELPFLGKIKREAKDQKLQLTAHVKFNHGSDPNVTIHDKVINITINGFDLPATRAEMQKELDSKYTLDKLRDSVTRRSVDANNIVNDIALPTPGSTGVDKYFDYKFTARTDNENIKIKGYRVSIIRPLPGQEPYEAKIVVNMEHRKNKVAVEKDFKIKVMPLTDEEINRELDLMDKARENYFEGIRGENTCTDKIDKNLRTFKEIYMEDGEVRFTYDIKDERNQGIFPDELESKDYQEEWRLFRTSNKRIIQHENLLVKQPKYNSKVKIDSVLSSKVYGKYAKIYPEDERFKKLYKQAVSVDVVVVGSEGIDNPEELKKELDIDYSIIYFDKSGRWNFNKEVESIKLKANEFGEASPYDLILASGLSYEGSNNFLGSIDNIKGPEPDPAKNIAGGGWMYSVNDIRPDKLIGDYVLKDGDRVLFYCTYDYKRDKMPIWTELKKSEDLYEIKILNKESKVKVGENLDLRGEVRKNGELLDENIIWSIESGEANIEDASLVAHKTGKLIVGARLEGNENVQAKFEIDIVVNDRLDIKAIVQQLREHYKNKAEFSFREALAYNYTSDNLKDDYGKIGEKIKLRENDSVSNVAGNILSLIAAGEDPYKYRGINYVEILQKAQKENGKFIISSKDNYPSVQAFGIIGLDMARAKYSEKAIDGLLSYQDASGSFADIDSDGMVLSALGNHLSREDVKKSVDKSLKYLRSNWYGENQWSLSAIIQGLIAVGEDVESERWTKNNSTIVDELLKYYSEAERFENSSADEQGFLALGDISKKKSVFREIRINDNQIDRIEVSPIGRKLYRNDSLYLDIRPKNKLGKLVSKADLKITCEDKGLVIDQEGKLSFKNPGRYMILIEDKNSTVKSEFEITVLDNLIEYKIENPQGEILSNNIYEFKADIENKSGDSRKIKFIVCIYEKETNKLLNYSIIEKTLEKDSKIDLSSGIKTDQKGDFYIKSFVWDENEIEVFAN